MLVSPCDTPIPSALDSPSPRASTPDLPLETEVMLAGFRDCTQEALTYLLQVEKLAPDDPIVMGLQRHLAEKEEELLRSHYTQTWSPNMGVYPQIMMPGLQPYPHYGYLTPNQWSFPPHVGNTPSQHLHMGAHIKQEPVFQIPSSANVSSNDSLGMEDTSLCDSEVDEILHHEVNQEGHPDWEAVKENASRLDGLAQNNEKIGSLMTELFGLLDEDDEISNTGHVYPECMVQSPMVPMF